MSTSTTPLDVSLAGTRRYSRDLTRLYRRYAGFSAGWHFGIWDAGVNTHVVSLLRSNQWLLKDLKPGKDTHILDLGCGGGGFATWAASRFGCRVTGVTLVPEHTRVAAELARSRKIGGKCRFEVACMDELPYADGTFDIVINQDSACYAPDKLELLAEVKRVLKPGGYWRAVDFSVQDTPLDAAQQIDYRTVCEGFQMPGLITSRDMQALLSALSFEDIRAEDITALVQPSAKHIQKLCNWPLLAMDMHMDWTFFGISPTARRNRQGCIRAADTYSRGLIDGCFRHVWYSARKPG
jgi:ubiquinone/menaquinone biosynthesis C-methylase UbiE